MLKRDLGLPDLLSDETMLLLERKETMTLSRRALMCCSASLNTNMLAVTNRATQNGRNFDLL